MYGSVIEEELLCSVFGLFRVDLELVELCFYLVFYFFYIWAYLIGELLYGLGSMNHIAFELFRILIDYVDKIEDFIYVESGLHALFRKVCQLFSVKGHNNSSSLYRVGIIRLAFFI